MMKKQLQALALLSAFFISNAYAHNENELTAQTTLKKQETAKIQESLQEETPIYSLHRELLELTFSYFNVKDLINLSLVSKPFSEISANHPVWEKYYKKLYEMSGQLPPPEPSGSYRSDYNIALFQTRDYIRHYMVRAEFLLEKKKKENPNLLSPSDCIEIEESDRVLRKIKTKVNPSDEIDYLRFSQKNTTKAWDVILSRYLKSILNVIVLHIHPDEICAKLVDIFLDRVNNNRFIDYPINQSFDRDRLVDNLEKLNKCLGPQTLKYETKRRLTLAVNAFYK